MTLSRAADYDLRFRRAIMRHPTKPAKEERVAQPKRLDFDAIFGPYLSVEEFGAYALFISAHL